MQFKYHKTDTLPSLAWCARVDNECDTVAVFHGEMVETDPRGFVEGAWNGSFEELDITSATVVCGTGGVLDDDTVRFSASTDSVCPLFSIVKDDSVFVSNSPVFVMAMAGEEPDPIYPFYSYDVTDIWCQGLYCPNGELKLSSDISLRVHFSTIMSADKHCSCQFEPHPLCDAPTDYQSYHTLLVKELKQVFENAQDPGRKSRYKPLAALSTGYDSTATAALASLAGCKEAITFTDSLMEDPRQDSGADNAPYFGMTCAEYDRWQYLKMDGRAEAEFAMFTVSANAPIAAMEDQLKGSLFIGGNLGDVIWDKNAKFYHNLSRSWSNSTAGLGQIEFRLRAGFIPIGPAYIGARHNEAIHRIINSEEMSDWSVGGKYDRPLPRRIAEEAGLPRDRFGIKKRACGHTHFTTPKNFSSLAQSDYRDFVSQQHATVPRKKYRNWRNLVQYYHVSWKLSKRFRQRDTPSKHRLQRRPFIAPSYFIIPWNFMFTFQWVFNSLKRRYQLPKKTNARPDKTADKMPA